MNIGLMLGATPNPNASINYYQSVATDCEARGFSSLWMAHIRSHDAVMAMALAAAATTTLEVGTAVTPIQPRHPMALAQQALTAQALADGRFTLGIGLSHKVVIESMLGLKYDKLAKTMREYLTALNPLLAGEEAAVEGDIYKVHIGLDVPDAPKPVPVVVAALGPMMLDVAGRLADGTCLWMTGPNTIASHIVPKISAAADQAERASPRVVAGFPIVLSNNENAARRQVGEALKVYGQLPSYRAMLDREGVDGPADLAIVGGENVVAERLQAVAEAGATDVIAVLVDTDAGTAAGTLDFLTEYNRG